MQILPDQNERLLKRPTADEFPDRFEDSRLQRFTGKIFHFLLLCRLHREIQHSREVWKELVLLEFAHAAPQRFGRHVRRRSADRPSKLSTTLCASQ